MTGDLADPDHVRRCPSLVAWRAVEQLGIRALEAGGAEDRGDPGRRLARRPELIRPVLERPTTAPSFTPAIWIPMRAPVTPSVSVSTGVAVRVIS